MALKKNKNPQNVLIESLEGIYLADAGAGTGKTYSIVKRYEKIIGTGSKPEDILLITFTKNAAEQMKDEVVKNLSKDVGINKLLEAPILTFHSFCSKILKIYGTNSPSYLGIDEYLPRNFNLLEDPSFEDELFRKYFLEFAKINSEKYKELLYSLDGEEKNVLSIIKKLCSIGIFPTSKGWKKEDRDKLEGNFREYSVCFDKLNMPLQGVKGEKQSKLNEKFKAIVRDKLYIDFEREKIILDKTVNPESKEEIFYDDKREEYIEFINDIYFSYIEFLLRRNLINFEFMIMFSYLILFNDKNARKKMQFEYVMIDEFQDTDELQFKLIMLVCKSMKGKANFCVVGDWKQGIYGFRNARIENITEFGKNLKNYKKELNQSDIRIEYEVDNYSSIIFERNYRSSESILKFSRETLFIKGTTEEEVNIQMIEENFKEPLKAERKLEDLTETGFFQAKNRLDEYQLVLKKISELVNEKERYLIRNFDNKTGEVIEERSVRYSDICVLSRTKKFCLELQREAMIAGIPLNYRGGLELFASEQGVLVLGWLKIMINEKDIYGWLPVLDKEGYNYQETVQFLKVISGNNNDTEKLFSDLPSDLSEFLNHLRKFRSNILFAIEAILSRYKFHDETGNKIITVVQSWMNSDLHSLNDLVKIIERSANTEFEIDFGITTDAVLTQTIHKSKGLEYPVVILANLNVKNFPDSKGERGNLVFNTETGLRAKTFFGTNGNYYYRYNNWKTDLSNTVVKNTDYDEERRLLYVAVTRAKQYLYFTSFNPSKFFTDLNTRSGLKISDDFEYEIKKAEFEKIPKGIEIKIDIPIEKRIEFISPHSLMEEIDFTNDVNRIDQKDFSVNFEKKSLDFGLKVHNIANRIARGITVETDLKEGERIKSFIENLNAGELKSEIDFIYPDKISGKTIRGTIDLLAFYIDKIEVIDYKTDSSKRNLEKYKLQLEIYMKAVKSIYKDKKVSGKIYFVSIDEIVEIENSEW